MEDIDTGGGIDCQAPRDRKDNSLAIVRYGQNVSYLKEVEKNKDMTWRVLNARPEEQQASGGWHQRSWTMVGKQSQK